MAYVPPSTWFSSAADWLQKPGSQNLLAGIGAKLDPSGIGGALGGATVGYNQSRVAEARAATQESALDEQRQSALKALQQMGLTPPGQPGPTKIEAKKDGGIVQTSDLVSPTVPGTGTAVQTPAAPTATGTSAAPTQMPPMTVTAQREPAVNPYATTAAVEPFDIRRIAPFS